MIFWRQSELGKCVNKVISTFIIQTFIFSGIAFAIPNDNNPVKINPQYNIAENPEKVVIPRDFGLVKSNFVGNSGRLVIHIQDAHCNYEAQSNIVKILENLVKNYKVSFVAVEGADGVIDTSWFKAFPDDEVRKEVADYFMKKGEITGPEFLSITTDYPIKLFGAETRDYYIQNLNAFTSSYPLKEDTEKYYQNVKTALNKLKGYIYSDELKAMDSKVEEYETKSIQFNDYVRFLQGLSETHKINLREYDNFFKLVSTLVYEKKINFNVVDKERSVLIDELSKTLAKDALAELVEKSLFFKAAKISSAEYYNYLKDVAAKHGIEMAKRFPNLSNYIIYTTVYSKIENEKLFKDIKNLEAAIKEKLFVNDDQRTLSKLSHNVDILLGLVNIKLLNGDFEYYKANKEEFSYEAFSGFLQKKTTQYGLSYDISSPSEAVINSIPKLESFYAIAIKRDRALVDNTLKAMNKEKVQVAVLVTGGFHSEGISKLLEKDGVSYMVVCPSITKEVPTRYIQILTNQRTSFEDILMGTAEARPAQTGMVAPYLISAARQLSDKDLQEMSDMVGSVKTGDGTRSIADRVKDFEPNWATKEVAVWIDGSDKFAGAEKIPSSREILEQAYLININQAMAAGKFAEADKAIINALVKAAFDKVYSAKAAGTPGTGASGRVLSADEAMVFDSKVIADSFTAEEARIDNAFHDVRPGFQFVIHRHLIRRADQVGLPANIHPGRSSTHDLLQAHIDEHVFNGLDRAEQVTVGRHELAHLDIFNIDEFVSIELRNRKIDRLTAEMTGIETVAPDIRDAAVARFGADAYAMWERWMGAGKPEKDGLEEFINSQSGCDVRPSLAKIDVLVSEVRKTGTAYQAKAANLAELRRIVDSNEGVTEVIAITNGGDSKIAETELNAASQGIFRRDGKAKIMAHEEVTRRGQLLGLLDAYRSWKAKNGEFDRDGVSLGIMMPGKGTRTSPFTQRRHGIKPFIEMLVRPENVDRWLSGAEASLYTWNLVAGNLKRLGFRGMAWKWGDEPQIASNLLAGLQRSEVDLNGADIVRFGSKSLVTSDLAENKEWLSSKPNGDLSGWARRRDRSALLEKLGIENTPDATAMVHIGSPAFSYIFLEQAEKIFSGTALEGKWIDVDGFLIEALTLSEEDFKKEVGSDEVLRQCPDFYKRCQLLKAAINAEKAKLGLPVKDNGDLAIKVIDFGDKLYWGDIGQLTKMRQSIYEVAEDSPNGEFARGLAGMDAIELDEFGNRVFGDCVYPKDGSVRNSVLVDTKIYGACDITGAVLVNSNLGNVSIGQGSVVYGSNVYALTMGERAFSYYSVGESLAIANDWVHTSVPKDLANVGAGLEDVYADSAVNVGADDNYKKPAFGNARSFEKLQADMRQRAISPESIEKGIVDTYVMNQGGLIDRMKELARIQSELSENLRWYDAHTKPLSFGTSGLRALDPQMTDMEVFVNTLGALRYLQSIDPAKGGIKPGDAVMLAADHRPSSPRIARAVAAAIVAAGCKVDWCGNIASPSVMYYAMYAGSRGMASIMITASHNPYYFNAQGEATYGYNGEKINEAINELLKREEKPLLKYVQLTRLLEYAKLNSQLMFERNGSFKSADDMDADGKALIDEVSKALANENTAARAEYIKRYTEAFGKIFDGEEIILWQQTAVGRDLIKEIFDELGAKVVPMDKRNISRTFVPVDSEDLKEEHLNKVRDLAREHYANTGRVPYAVITADGDSDRPLLFIVSLVDGEIQVEYITGNKLGVLASLFLEPDFVALTATADNAPLKALPASTSVARVQVGSPHINLAMIEALDANPGMIAIGFEGNGGMLIGTDINVRPLLSKQFGRDQGGVLKRLPTRDAVLPLISALLMAKKAGSVERLARNTFKDDAESYTFQGGITNADPGCDAYTAEFGKMLIKSISTGNAKIGAVKFGPNGKVEYVTGDEIKASAREKRDEAAIEADKKLAARALSIRNKLMQYFTPIQNLGTIDRIEYIDGVRIYFDNGEIVHLRPSGNEAKFRFFAEAGTVRRSIEMGQKRVEVLAGIIRTSGATAARATPGIYSANAGRNDAGRTQAAAVETPAAVFNMINAGNLEGAVNTFFTRYSADQAEAALAMVSNNIIVAYQRIGPAQRKEYRARAEKFYSELVKRSLEEAVNVDTIKALQIMAGQTLNMLMRFENGPSDMENIRITIDPAKMLRSPDKERGPSYIDVSVEAETTVAEAEGRPGMYWRGYEGVAKMGAIDEAAIYDKEKFDAVKDSLVLYIMFHYTPKGTQPSTLQMVSEGSLSAFHETPFVNDMLPYTVRNASTGPGHFQGTTLDIKYVTEGRGIQYNKIYDANGKLIRVIAQELKPGTWVAAIPGAVDSVEDLGGLRFNDFSMKVPQEALKGLNPWFDFGRMAEAEKNITEAAKTIPYYAITSKGETVLVKNDASAPEISWSMGIPAREMAAPSAIELYKTLNGAEGVAKIIKVVTTSITLKGLLMAQSPIKTVPNISPSYTDVYRIASSAQAIISTPASGDVVTKKYAWGGEGIGEMLGMGQGGRIAELWFNSTQADGLTTLQSNPNITLAQAIEANPRAMLGPGMKVKPIFAKILGRDETQPQMVHAGFNENIIGNEKAFVDWIIQERDFVTELQKRLAALNMTEDQFAQYSRSYEAWVSGQVAAKWTGTALPALPEFMAGFDTSIFNEMRDNRAKIVSVMNEVKLEPGQVIISPVGYIHSIVGSHQTHPPSAHPEAKNEAWYIFSIGKDAQGKDRLLYFEPQQTSNTTYSPFDFPTPIVWKDGLPSMRKDLTKGLGALLDTGESAPATEADAIRMMAARALNFSATKAEDFVITNRTRDITGSFINPVRAKAEALIEGTYPVWPRELFTLNRITLTGEGKESPASITVPPVAGSYHEIEVLKGQANITMNGQTTVLTPGSSVFVPALNQAPYELKAEGSAEILMLYPSKTQPKVEAAEDEAVRKRTEPAPADGRTTDVLATIRARVDSGTGSDKLSIDDVKALIEEEKKEAEVTLEASMRRADVDDGVVIIATDDNLYKGPANAAVTKWPATINKNAKPGTVVVVRGKGAELEANIKDAIERIGGEGKVRKIVTQL